jgi:drug/metabolite transporter (DMT)-like permease
LSNQSRGILLALGGASLFSFDGLLVRLQALSPAGVIFWRGLLSGIVFAAMAALARKRVAKQVTDSGGIQWWPVSLLAGLVVLGTITFVLSLTHTTVAHTVVIVAASPIVTGILGRFILREHLPIRTWLAGLAALTGVVVVVSGSLRSSGLQGDLWALANTGIFALLLISLRRYQSANLLVALAISGFAVALVVSPWAGQNLDLKTAIAAALDGLLVVPGGLVLITLAPRYLPAAEVGLLLLIETILAPVWVLLVIGEALTFQVVLSAAIILGAIGIHSFLDLRDQTPNHAAGGET